MSMTEGKYTGEFLLSEAPGTLSRENATVTVAAATKLSPGHVLAKLSADGSYVEYDNAGTDGSETAAAILWEEADNSAGSGAVDFKRTVIARLAEVRDADLTYFSGASAGDKTAAKADLATAHIVAR